VVKDPKPSVDPTKRTISVSGKEDNSSNTLAGDPTLAGTGGAILEIFANGRSSTSQAFVLSQGSTSAGKPFWSGDATKGFKYKDAQGEQGAVKSVRIGRSRSGVFSVRIKIAGQAGPVDVLPPNPGTDGCAALRLGLAPHAGDRYSLQFGPESKIKTSQKLFTAEAPTAEGICPTLLAPCGEACGGACPNGEVCGAIQGLTSFFCQCFSPNEECGGASGYSCTPMFPLPGADCLTKQATCCRDVLGTCPAGSTCTLAIGHVFGCLSQVCVVVDAMCVP